MHILLTFLLIAGVFTVLLFGLVSLLDDMMGLNAEDRDLTHPPARSQFAWQSRSHFRARD
jgi:hypothetical protein